MKRISTFEKHLQKINEGNVSPEIVKAIEDADAALNKVLRLSLDRVAEDAIKSCLNVLGGIVDGEGNTNSKYPFPIYKGDVSTLETQGDGETFFTRDKEMAKYYTWSRQQQGISPKTNSTFTAYLDTKNPLIVDALRPSPIELKDKSGNVLGIFGKGDYIQKVKAAGYDAIIINKKFGDESDGWEIVSFNRAQIKKARKLND